MALCPGTQWFRNPELLKGLPTHNPEAGGDRGEVEGGGKRAIKI